MLKEHSTWFNLELTGANMGILERIKTVILTVLLGIPLLLMTLVWAVMMIALGFANILVDIFKGDDS